MVQRPSLSCVLCILLVGVCGVEAFQLTTTPPCASGLFRPPAAVHSLKISHVSREKLRVKSPNNLKSTTNGTKEASPASVDYDALVKYISSILIQMFAFAGTFAALDAIVDATGIRVPSLAVGALFYVFSLKSRIFNPLSNERPKIPTGPNDSSPGFRDRVMLSWTPPGVTFPIMWILIIGPIRALTSALVYGTTQHFLNPALLAFVFHLSVGDVWNTINNVDRRYGASVTGVLCVTASALNAAYQYYKVNSLAGKLLGLTLLWFAVASSLITATWKLNPDPSTGKKDPLYPIIGDKKTEFAWFRSAGSSKDQ